MDIYNVRGRLVRSLQGDAATEGWQELRWDGLDNAGGSVPSGSYLMRVQAGGKLQTVRGLLVE